jgi:DNA topoisomerase-2
MLAMVDSHHSIFASDFWPTLLDVPGFLQQFITPIVKVSKGKKAKTFFNLPEYEQWLESTGTNGKGWNIKYYKGLGTSTSAEAKEYFSNLDLHEINFAQLSIDKVDAEDDLDAVLPDRVQSGSDLIDMVFRKTRVEDRKKWLDTKVSPETFLDYTLVKKEGVKFSEFLNKEYILFSHYDNVRSIPHFMDGFKPSQRKVLYGCFKRKLKGEIKVAQLTGYVAEHSVYHHGEQSLQGTIVVMASNYCGSNNINLLTPSGQFGTRRMGGKDAASARYIFTKLEPITRAIFHPDDDELLNYLKDDGSTIEPEYYVPVIPMILVNGSEGIGSGWSSYIPNYNPREIIANLRRMIANEDVLPMTPFYHGFTGEVCNFDRTEEDISMLVCLVCSSSL